MKQDKPPSTATSNHHPARFKLQDPPTKPGFGELSWQREREPPQPFENPVIEGWDTETENGRAFLASNSNRYVYVDSWEQILGFLTGRDARGKLNFWWNLDYDVTAVLKWKPHILQAVTEDGFYRERGADGEETLFISYLPRKSFKIRRHNKNTVHHYDAAQFYRSSLAHAAERYLGREQHELKSERHRAHELPRYQVAGYCQWDATATRDLARLYMDKLHALDLYPRRCISPGNLAEQLIRVHGDVPTWHHNPRWANVFSWQSAKGAWIDVHQRGYFDEVWKYDINSAYPYIMTKIPDLRHGHWVDHHDPDQYIGFALCDVTYKDTALEFAPSFLADINSNLFPFLDQPTRCWLTNHELACLEPHAEIQILDATTFIPSHDNPGSPWEELLLSLQSMKNDAQDDPGLYLATKALINSFYGKTYQKIEQDDGSWRTGKLFNPVVASTILASCRCMIWEAVQGHQDVLISVATDSIVTDRPMNHLDLGEDLGQWDEEDAGVEGVFVRPGVYQVGDEVHTRGFKPVRDEEGEVVPLTELLRVNSDKVTIEHERPISSREAVHWNRLHDANVFVERPYTITVHEQRRIWEHHPRVFKELTETNWSSIGVPVSATDLLYS